ncbi:Signal transduction histidine kinase CheA [hydrothermal vent metagenome]|uniref:histidine kinase n=1 Tax=hydrothermal vent metagenome TaxID=652676 RepID=A0A3B0Z5Y9_9ZZZZ
MAIDTDDEILQDFLVEADEILEKLGEQLVDLEQSPDDTELLNAVFRGFHTIKGGAGFLALTALVEVCHHAEDVFNILRQGDRVVDAPLMDAFLRVTDSVNDMFGEVREGIDPTPADPELIETLKRFLSGDEEQEQAPAPELTPEPVIETPATSPSGGSEEITDDEFESLLDQLHGGAAPTAVKPDAPKITDSVADANSGSNDEITDDEFESLLDQLHGDGAPKSVAPEAPAENLSVEKKEAQPTAKIEPVVKPAKPTPAKTVAKKKENSPAQAETTVRVDTKRLDDIMNLVGELVLVRNRLSTLESTKSDEAMTQAVANLDLVTTDLQNSVMKTRMQPIKKVFGRFPRVVRDLARSLKKEVGLELIGEETDLDKNLVEALADPLVHLIRNSVDHGIEMPDVREKAGKDRVGAVVLSAAQEGDHILLTIDDDGAGMDANKLRSIAVSKGLYDEDAAARLDDKECFNLIFMPGFSTKEEISDISGRGVGMDVVKTRIAQLNGSIDIDSAMGKGSRIAIKLPLTLAIMPTLMVLLEEQVFALPLVSVVEIFNLDLTESKVVDGQPVVLIRNKALPIFYLKEWLIKGASRSEKQKKGHVVVVSSGAQQIGFVVDQLIGQEEVVIKPLGSMLHGTRGLAGATITGNGKISLILDVPELLTAYA